MSDKQNFEFNNVSFDYHLIKQDRKTITATVYPNLELLVKVPLHAAPEGIESFLQRKLRWILKQKKYFAQFKPEQQKQYISGETFRYRGRSYKLLLHSNYEYERVSLQHGVINIFMSAEKSSVTARELLNGWYSKSAERVFFERVQECYKLFNYSLPVPEVIIRKMNKRWGSYSRGQNTIRLNGKLIQSATRFIDYVIIHELCHIQVEKHNREFYALLEKKLPNWQQLKTELELYLLGV